MKLTTAEFADNADSVEALTAKQKLLQKQFDEQAKKAEAAEKALKKMRDNGIEPTNPAYQKMQTNLNNTKADMVKIQKEIDDTSKKLKSSKVDWESVGETVGKAGKAIGAACAAMGAAIAAAGAAFFGLAEETREARENMGNLKPASRRRDIRQRTRKTPIRSCTAFLATTDRQRKPPRTLRS
jgi:chromosome segregation ATPase